MIDIRVKTPDIRSLRFLDGKGVLFAEAQALNRTASNVHKKGVQLVARELGVPAKDIFKRGRKLKSSTKFGTVSKGKKALPRRLEVGVTGYGRPFNVGRWKGAEIRAGASVGISKSGKRRNQKGTRVVVGVTHSAYGRDQFTPKAWMLNNGAVVVRKGKSFRGVWGPGIAQIMEKPKVEAKLRKKAIEKFDKHFASSLKFVFSGQARSTGALRG